MSDRIWFYRPECHWFGWKALVPLHFGNDEYCRKTICIGWTVTGRVVVALWFYRDCGDGCAS